MIRCRVLLPALLFWGIAATTLSGTDRGDLVAIGSDLARTPEVGKVKMDETSFNVFKEDYLASLKAGMGNRVMDMLTLGPLATFQAMFQEHLSSRVRSMPFQYASRDSHGHDRVYSGRVFLPAPKTGLAIRPVPLVIYQHATETRRKAAPSLNKGDETMLGAIAAELGGFAVAMPDGDGMGMDDQEPHAYCHGETAANCIIDCIRALVGTADQTDPEAQSFLFSPDYAWNGQTYIMGYSEGGYIAMAAVRAISRSQALKDQTHLVGAACMGGPFAFAKATADLLSASNQTPYDRPYIPAYFVNAWSSLYKGSSYESLFRLKETINPKLLEGDNNILRWLDGSMEMTSGVITDRIQARLNQGKAVTARSILNERWSAEYLDKPSTVTDLIKANDLVDGWKPDVPVLLVHDPFDPTVGFESTKAMYESWQRQGADPIGIVEMGTAGMGTGHVVGALVAIPAAFVWIDAGMPRSLMDLAVNALQTKIARFQERLTEPNPPDQPLLPVSKVAFGGKAASYKVDFGDLFAVVGKVKFYTIEPRPSYPGQPALPGGGYTRLLAVLRDKGDTLEVKPDQRLVMAVYPSKAMVALTLRFTGTPYGSTEAFTCNIKQLKTRFTARQLPPALSPSRNFSARVHAEAFESGNQEPFLELP